MKEKDKEYIEEFIREAERRYHREIRYFDSCSAKKAFDLLISKKYLSEVDLAKAYRLLQGLSMRQYEDFSLELRTRTGEGQTPRELLRHFITGWTTWAPDHSNTTLKALAVLREFRMAEPFPTQNGRLALLLYLWMTIRNNLPRKIIPAKCQFYDRIPSDALLLKPAYQKSYLIPYSRWKKKKGGN